MIQNEKEKCSLTSTGFINRIITHLVMIAPEQDRREWKTILS